MTLSIVSFTRAATKTVAGNYDRLFGVPAADIATVTYTDNKVSAITMASGKKFANLQADLDSVVYNGSGEGGRGYFSEQTLIAKFSQKNLAMETLISELLKGAIAGLAFIRVDSNGIGWLSGVAPAAAELRNRPYLMAKDEFTSGENIEAVEDGNRLTLTFTRKSGTREYQLADALTALILTKATAFIDGHTPG